MRLHNETGIPLVCTNDAHYLRKEDAENHDVLLCIQTGKTVDDENRMRYEPRNFYIRSTEEMETLFAGYPDAVANTEKIAENASWNSPSASTTCRNSSCRRGTTRLHICGSYAMRGLLSGTVRQSRNIGSSWIMSWI